MMGRAAFSRNAIDIAAIIVDEFIPGMSVAGIADTLQQRAPCPHVIGLRHKKILLFFSYYIILCKICPFQCVIPVETIKKRS